MNFQEIQLADGDARREEQMVADIQILIHNQDHLAMSLKLAELQDLTLLDTMFNHTFRHTLALSIQM
jgi:hypothetical protein